MNQQHTDPHALGCAECGATSPPEAADKRLTFSKTFDVTSGGSVETFRSRADAVRRFKYVGAIGKTSIFAEYDYLGGNVLLRLSHVLTPVQAATYKRALLKFSP